MNPNYSRSFSVRVLMAFLGSRRPTNWKAGPDQQTIQTASMRKTGTILTVNTKASSRRLLLLAVGYYCGCTLALRALAFQHFLVPNRAFRRAWRSATMPPLSRSLSTDAAATPLQGDDRPEVPPIDRNAKRLFLVRHGEVINPGGDRPVYYGALDVPLSPLGEQEAQAAASYLLDHAKDIDLVVSSPLSRAIYGADQVVKLLSSAEDLSTKLPRPLTTFEGFRELDRGAWCGLTKDEIGADAMAKFDACDESVTPEGGESYSALKDRVLQARNEVLYQLSTGRAAVVVSHLQVTRSMLSEALNMATNEMAALKVATASITCIDYYCDDNNQKNDKEKSGNQEFRGKQIVRFQSFKPDVGLAQSKDGAN